MQNTLTLALSKGRIFKETLPLLKAAGIEPIDDPETSRKLILDTNQDDVKLSSFVPLTYLPMLNMVVQISVLPVKMC